MTFLEWLEEKNLYFDASKLEEMFDAEIDKEGPINIMGTDYELSYTYKAVNLDFYNADFSEWIEDSGYATIETGDICGYIDTQGGKYTGEDYFRQYKKKHRTKAEPEIFL